MSQPNEHTSYMDSLVDEVRRVRKALADTFENDIDKLCEYLRQIEEQHQERVINPVQEPVE